MILPSDLGPLLLKTEWQYANHIKQFEALAIRLIYGDLKKLLVEVPVRHGKSYFWSVLVPTWYLLCNPFNKVIIVSYSSDLAAEFAGKCRDLLLDMGCLDPAYKARDYFKTRTGGELKGCGVGSSLAGRGADLLIGDDCCKDVEEISNPNRREKLYQWWMSEACTRLSPKGKVIMVQSCRHPDDIVGRLKKSNEELPEEQQWHLHRFPAINENNEPLWPERFNLEKLNQIKNEFIISGFPYLWESLYQQNPINFENLEWPLDYMPIYYTHRPDPPRFKIMGLDPSVGRSDKSGDYPALIYAEITPDSHVWIEDASMKILPINQIEDLAVLWINKYKPDAFIVETNGFQELVAKNILRKCPTAPVYMHNSTENKQVRIRMALSPILAQHRLHFKQIPANKIIWQQFREFPTGLHDDGPDAIQLVTTMANKLINNNR